MSERGTRKHSTSRRKMEFASVPTHCLGYAKLSGPCKTWAILATVATFPFWWSVSDLHHWDTLRETDLDIVVSKVYYHTIGSYPMQTNQRKPAEPWLSRNQKPRYEQSRLGRWRT